MRTVLLVTLLSLVLGASLGLADQGWQPAEVIGQWGPAASPTFQYQSKSSGTIIWALPTDEDSFVNDLQATTFVSEGSDGLSFDEETLLITNNQQANAVTSHTAGLAKNGRAHAVWMNNNAIWHSHFRKTKKETAWSTPQKLSAEGTYVHPTSTLKLAVAKNGIVFVAWIEVDPFSGTTTRPIHVKRFHPRKLQWSETLVVNPSSTAQAITLSTDAKGRDAYLMWSDTDQQSDTKIQVTNIGRYFRLKPNKATLSVITLSGPFKTALGGSATELSLAQGRKNALAVWQVNQEGEFGTQIRGSYWQAKPNIWSAPFFIHESPGVSGGDPQAVFCPTGDAHVVWKSQLDAQHTHDILASKFDFKQYVLGFKTAKPFKGKTNDELRASFGAIASASFSDEAQLDQLDKQSSASGAGFESTHPRLVCDRQGNVTVTWYELTDLQFPATTEHEVHAITFNREDSEWQNETVIGTGTNLHYSHPPKLTVNLAAPNNMASGKVTVIWSEAEPTASGFGVKPLSQTFAATYLAK